MKFVLAAAVLAAFSTSAYAEGFGVNGYGEYAFEAEVFEFGLGATYTVDAITAYLDVVFVNPVGEPHDLEGVDLGVAYDANEYISVFTEVSFDEDLDYSDVTVGAAFSF